MSLTEELAGSEDYTPLPPQVFNDDITFEAKVFVLRALCEKASAVIPTKDIMPVLKNFQVEVADERLRVVATDLELSVICTTEMVDRATPGTAVFPGKKMLEIIREAEDGDALIVVNQGVATITVGRTEWSIRLMDGSDYPDLPEVDDLEMHKLERVAFLGALRAVRYAAATETVRQSLMMIDITAGKMRAADGVRFQQVDLGDDFPLDIQIPIGAVDDLVRLLQYTDVPDLEIGQGDNHLVFKLGTDVFVANKLVAQFPDIESVLLKPAMANDQELTIDHDELADAIKRVKITADQETSAISLDLAAGKVTVRAKDKLGNFSREEIDAGWSSPDRTVVVNYRFLMDMLNMASVKTCHLFLGPDSKTRKSVVLLRDDETGQLGTIQQMRADWVTD